MSSWVAVSAGVLGSAVGGGRKGVGVGFPVGPVGEAGGGGGFPGCAILLRGPGWMVPASMTRLAWLGGSGGAEPGGVEWWTSPARPVASREDAGRGAGPEAAEGGCDQPLLPPDIEFGCRGPRRPGFQVGPEYLEISSVVRVRKAMLVMHGAFLRTESRRRHQR